MNATVEQEIIEKFDGLDSDGQARVRAAIKDLPGTKGDLKAWRERQQEITERIKSLEGVTKLTYMDLLSDTRGEVL